MPVRRAQSLLYFAKEFPKLASFPKRAHERVSNAEADLSCFLLVSPRRGTLMPDVSQEPKKSAADVAYTVVKDTFYR